MSKASDYSRNIKVKKQPDFILGDKISAYVSPNTGGLHILSLKTLTLAETLIFIKWLQATFLDEETYRDKKIKLFLKDLFKSEDMSSYVIAAYDKKDHTYFAAPIDLPPGCMGLLKEGLMRVLDEETI